MRLSFAVLHELRVCAPCHIRYISETPCGDASIYKRTVKQGNDQNSTDLRFTGASLPDYSTKEVKKKLLCMYIALSLAACHFSSVIPCVHPADLYALTGPLENPPPVTTTTHSQIIKILPSQIKCCCCHYHGV